MKLYQIADQAIRENNKRMAEALCILINKRFNLSLEGIREYLEAHHVDLDGWDELLAQI